MHALLLISCLIATDMTCVHLAAASAKLAVRVRWQRGSVAALCQGLVCMYVGGAWWCLVVLEVLGRCWEGAGKHSTGHRCCTSTGYETEVEAAAQQQPAAPALCHEACAHAGLAGCEPGLVYGIIWAPEQAAKARA